MKLTDWLIQKGEQEQQSSSPPSDLKMPPKEKKASLGKEKAKQSAGHTPGKQKENHKKQKVTPGKQKETSGKQKETPGKQKETKQKNTPGKKETPGKQKDKQKDTPGKQKDTPRKQKETPGKQSEKSKVDTVLPQSKIKLIIKSSPEVDQVGADVLYVITKATEMFIEHMTKTTYNQAHKPKNLEYNHLAEMAQRGNNLEFLKDIIPVKMSARDALKEVEKQRALQAQEWLGESSS